MPPLSAAQLADAPTSTPTRTVYIVTRLTKLTPRQYLERCAARGTAGIRRTRIIPPVLGKYEPIEEAYGMIEIEEVVREECQGE